MRALERHENALHLRLVSSNAAPKGPSPAKSTRKRGRKSSREKMQRRPDESDSFHARFVWLFERLEERHPELSQTAVADRYGLDSGQIARLLSGDRDMTLRTLKAFSQRSRINLQYLVLGEGREDFL